MKIILASQSPRRWELLARLGLPFSAQAPDIDETMEPGEDPAREVARVSRAKAMAVEAAPEDVVIAADTIVVCNGRVLGKPGTPEQAQQMLKLLSGRDHQVMTGLTVRRGATVFDRDRSEPHFFPSASGGRNCCLCGDGRAFGQSRRLWDSGGGRAVHHPAGRRFLQCDGAAFVCADFAAP